MGSPILVEDDRYSQLARREAELAEQALERSRGAWLYALSQENEGMRDHFIRIAAQARFAWTNHQRMARHFESRAEQATRLADATRVKTPTSSSKSRRQGRRLQQARPLGTVQTRPHRGRKQLEKLLYDFAVSHRLAEPVPDPAT